MVQDGGYPQWFDDVPKGMSRKKYLRLEKNKPKYKSMKAWIKENKKVKRTRKRKVSQKGGFCPPCLLAPLAGAMSLGTAGYMVSKSSSSNVNGKKIFKRKESYSTNKNGKKIKKVYEQKNNRIYLNGKEIKPRLKDINKATKILDKKIKECVESGFKKC